MTDYPDRYESTVPPPPWEKLLFSYDPAGRRLQTPELNEIQSVIDDYLQRLGGSVFEDGSLIDVLPITSIGSSPSIILTMGVTGTSYRITALQKVRYIEGGQTVTITGVGTEVVGLIATTSTVTSTQDPTLKDPVSGSPNFGLPGADRLEVTFNWALNGTTSGNQTWIPIYTFSNGLLNSVPQSSTLTDILQELSDPNVIQVSSTSSTTSSGPNIAGAGTDVASSPLGGNQLGVPWTNPGAVASTTSSATATITPTSLITDSLFASNFGFSIPVNSTILGIVVQINYGSSGTLGVASSIYASLSLPQSSGNPAQSSQKPLTLTNVNTTAIFGSPSDLWGFLPTVAIAPSFINSSSFGVNFTALSSTLSGNLTVSISNVQVTVYYSTGGNTISLQQSLNYIYSQLGAISTTLGSISNSINGLTARMRNLVLVNAGSASDATILPLPAIPFGHTAGDYYWHAVAGGPVGNVALGIGAYGGSSNLAESAGGSRGFDIEIININPTTFSMHARHYMFYGNPNSDGYPCSAQYFIVGVLINP